MCLRVERPSFGVGGAEWRFLDAGEDLGLEFPSLEAGLLAARECRRRFVHTLGSEDT